MMDRSPRAWLGLLAGLLVACGQSTHDGGAGASAGGAASGAGGSVGSSVAGAGAGAQGGQPALNVDPSLTEPVPDAPQDGCSCSDAGLGVTVALGDSSERLSFNIAGVSACAVDQSA